MKLQKIKLPFEKTFYLTRILHISFLGFQDKKKQWNRSENEQIKPDIWSCAPLFTVTLLHQLYFQL